MTFVKTTLGPQKYVILQGYCVIYANIVLNFHVIANDNIISHEHILTKRAASSDPGTCANVHPVPDARPIAYLCTFIDS